MSGDALTRRSLLSELAAAAMVAPFGQAAAQEATGLEEIDVPYSDDRDVSRDAVQSIAVSVSRGAQTIVLYNPTNEIWDAVMDGIRREILLGETAINGVILASGEEREVAFYANSQLTETILNPDPSKLSSEVRASLQRDYNSHIKPLDSFQKEPSLHPNTEN